MNELNSYIEYFAMFNSAIKLIKILSNKEKIFVFMNFKILSFCWELRFFTILYLSNIEESFNLLVELVNQFIQYLNLSRFK